MRSRAGETRRTGWRARIGAVAVAAILALPAVAQDFSDVEIEATQVAPGVHMLTGRGGNIGVSSGDDGIVLVDDQYAPLHARIVAAVAKLNAGPVRFVLNTHWHFDHTGGNELFAEGGAAVVAHEAVRERLRTDQVVAAFDMKVPASPPGAWPIVTFTKDVTFHLNGEEIHAFHVPKAHTDGDVIVHFRKADVLHTGDAFIRGFPFIDISSGGSFDGIVAAADRILAIAGPKTRIIPGHGPLSARGDVERFRAMLVTTRERVAAGIAAGRDLAAIQAEGPVAEFDEEWGGGFIDATRFVEFTYQSLGGS